MTGTMLRVSGLDAGYRDFQALFTQPEPAAQMVWHTPDNRRVPAGDEQRRD